MPHAVTVRKLAPALHAEATKTHMTANPDHLESLRNGAPLADVAHAAVGLTDDEREYFESMPRAVAEAIRGALLAAITDEKDVHIQFSPAYDFEVRVWDFGDAVGVHVGGPYTPGTVPARLQSGK
jgi:hypothetical protein